MINIASVFVSEKTGTIFKINILFTIIDLY